MTRPDSRARREEDGRAPGERVICSDHGRRNRPRADRPSFRTLQERNRDEHTLLLRCRRHRHGLVQPARHRARTRADRLRAVPGEQERHEAERRAVPVRRERRRRRAADPRAHRSLGAAAEADQGGLRRRDPRDGADRGPPRVHDGRLRPHPAVRRRAAEPTAQASRQGARRAAVHRRARGRGPEASPSGRVRHVDRARRRHRGSLPERGPHPRLGVDRAALPRGRCRRERRRFGRRPHDAAPVLGRPRSRREDLPRRARRRHGLRLRDLGEHLRGSRARRLHARRAARGDEGRARRRARARRQRRHSLLRRRAEPGAPARHRRHARARGASRGEDRLPRQPARRQGDGRLHAPRAHARGRGAPRGGALSRPALPHRRERGRLEGDRRRRRRRDHHLGERHGRRRARRPPPEEQHLENGGDGAVRRLPVAGHDRRAHPLRRAGRVPARQASQGAREHPPPRQLLGARRPLGADRLDSRARADRRCPVPQPRRRRRAGIARERAPRARARREILLPGFDESFELAAGTPASKGRTGDRPDPSAPGADWHAAYADFVLALGRRMEELDDPRERRALVERLVAVLPETRP